MKDEPRDLTLKSPYIPQFIRDISELMSLKDQSSGENVSLPRAMHTIFEGRKIAITVEGDTSVFEKEEGKPQPGILFIGDHRQGLESAPALAFLGKVGRSDVSFFAKPYSLPARLINSALGSTLAQKGGIFNNSAVLPVVPPSLTADVPSALLSGDSFFKFINRFSKHKLLSLKEALKVNIGSVKEAARQLGEGHCVVMSPTSRIADAMDPNESWEKGLGMVLKYVDPSLRNRVKIVPARFDDFSKPHLVHSLLGKERLKAPLELTLRLGAPISLDEIMSGNGTKNGEATVEEIRRRFTASFKD